MRLPSNKNARSALLATGMVFLALTAFWYALLGEYAHFPLLPPSLGVWVLVVCGLLGAPGLLIATWTHFPPGDGKLIFATIATWIFYFGVFRLVFRRGRRIRGLQDDRA